MEERHLPVRRQVVEERPPVPGLADDGEEAGAGEESRRRVVLDLARNAALAAAVAIDGEDLPVAIGHHLEREPAAVVRQRGAGDPLRSRAYGYRRTGGRGRGNQQLRACLLVLHIGQRPAIRRKCRGGAFDHRDGSRRQRDHAEPGGLGRTRQAPRCALDEERCRARGVHRQQRSGPFTAGDENRGSTLGHTIDLRRAAGRGAGEQDRVSSRHQQCALPPSLQIDRPFDAR